ncbi:mCG147186 [Mus musculus]|jgi:hypothetical protein|nr:mCG147186 [Mus musculus]
MNKPLMKHLLARETGQMPCSKWCLLGFSWLWFCCCCCFVVFAFCPLLCVYVYVVCVSIWVLFLRSHPAYLFETGSRPDVLYQMWCSWAGNLSGYMLAPDWA